MGRPTTNDGTAGDSAAGEGLDKVCRNSSDVDCAEANADGCSELRLTGAAFGTARRLGGEHSRIAEPSDKAVPLC